MKYTLAALFALLVLPACGKQEAPRRMSPVPFTAVHIDDKFWAPKIEINRTVSIPSAFKQCEKNGRLDNFALAGGKIKGEHKGDYPFDDTDVYKVVEGASYALELDKYNVVAFKPVRTSAIRMKVKLQKGNFAGILAWKVI